MSFLQDRNRRAVIGVVFGALIFFSFGIFTNLNFRSAQLDLTENKLYTLSAGTKTVLASIEEPLTLRLYFSSELGKTFPQQAAYYAQVRELLERYADLSGGGIQLQLFDPEPFSELEDEAAAFGLQGVPMNQAAEQGYFGLAATNAVDGRQVIPFFTQGRAPFLEYDLTKLIHNLISPEQKTIGLISSLPLDGGFVPGQRPLPPWAVMTQVREFFDVTPLPAVFDEVPDAIDLLMIVHPKGLNDTSLYAIDQFVLRGGRAIVFMDPNAELEQPARGAQPGPSDLGPLLASWGVELADDKVAADLDSARRVNVQHEGQLTVTDYIAWLTLGEANLAKGDPLIADMHTLNLGSSGALSATEGATTTFEPLIWTGTNSQLIEADKLRGRIDVIAMFRDFRADPERYTLAARVEGAAKTAYPDGRPGGEAPAEAELQPHTDEAPDGISIVVVADSDMLHEGLWADTRELYGQQTIIPYANNGDFVLNALEVMSGAEALAGLRSRGDASRPFTKVEQIQLEAERQFREEQEKLTVELQETQARLTSMTTDRNVQGETVLTDEEKDAVRGFQTRMSEIRRDLRDVQHNLRKDIEQLDATLKFVNIALVPLMLGLIALIIAMVRRSRRRAAA